MKNQVSRSWSKTYSTLALANAIIAVVWTLIIILPFEPTAFILPVMAGGGPGTWLVLGYILYIAVGFLGFTAFSYIFYTVENIEARKPDPRLAPLGLVLTYIGVTGATFLLGIAGASGGHASTIPRIPTQTLREMLLPYVNVITLLVLVTAAGVIINILSIVVAKPVNRG